METIRTEPDRFSGSVEIEDKILAKAKSLGEILRKYPHIQSNSPELYVLSYLGKLGSRKI